MDKSTAYLHFRDYLLMADIPHDDKGPRIHDFRHGLAVENLRRWAKEGADMSNKLPYLPEMIEMMEKACLDIIPEGGFEDNAES